VLRARGITARPVSVSEIERVVAYQERLAQLPLELGNLGAYPGLAHVLTGGGAGERTLVDDGHEVAKLVEFHMQ